MKKITMLLLAAMLLIGIASAACAFEYAPAEKLEIDGIEVNKVWVDMIPVYYTLPADYQEGQDMKICLFLSGLSGNKESLVSTYSDFITSRGYVGVFFDHYEHGERSINGTTILNSSEDEVAALKKIPALKICIATVGKFWATPFWMPSASLTGSPRICL